MKRFLAIVHGRVQGVGYRLFVQSLAQSLGVVGYVRNLPDGSVEVMAQGAPEALEHLLSRLRQGPPGALVSEVELHGLEPTDEYDRFEIRR